MALCLAATQEGVLNDALPALVCDYDGTWLWTEE